MNKELSSALSDIEGVLFGLEEVSDALCIYHGRMEDELALLLRIFAVVPQRLKTGQIRFYPY